MSHGNARIEITRQPSVAEAANFNRVKSSTYFMSNQNNHETPINCMTELLLSKKYSKPCGQNKCAEYH